MKNNVKTKAKTELIVRPIKANPIDETSIIHPKFIPSKKMELMAADKLVKVNLRTRKKHWGKRIMSNQTGMLYGPRGCGKTWIAICIAISMSAGVDFLEAAPTNSRKVIYLDGEMDFCSFKERLIKMCASLDTPVPSNLRAFTPESFEGMLPSITTPEGQKMIDDMIGIDWDVIIIDNYSAWSGDGRETPEAFAPLNKWMLRHKHAGRCVIVVHHSGKKGGQRGSSRHEDALDWSISIIPVDSKNTDGNLRIQMTWEKNRHLPSNEAMPIYATMSNVNGKLVWKLSEGKFMDPTTARILDLKKDPKMTTAKIAAILDVDPSTVNRHLKAIKS